MLVRLLAPLVLYWSSPQLVLHNGLVSVHELLCVCLIFNCVGIFESH